MDDFIEKRRRIVKEFLEDVGVIDLPEIVNFSTAYQHLYFSCIIDGVKWIFVFDIAGEQLCFSGDGKDQPYEAISPVEIERLKTPPSDSEMRAEIIKEFVEGNRVSKSGELKDVIDIVKRNRLCLPDILRGDNMKAAREEAFRQRRRYGDIRSQVRDEMRKNDTH